MRDWRAITAGAGFLVFSEDERCSLASVNRGTDGPWSKSIKEDSEAWEEAKEVERGIPPLLLFSVAGDGVDSSCGENTAGLVILTPPWLLPDFCFDFFDELSLFVMVATFSALMCVREQ